MLRSIVISVAFLSHVAHGFIHTSTSPMLRNSLKGLHSLPQPSPRKLRRAALQMLDRRTWLPGTGSETLTKTGRQSSFTSAQPVLEHQDVEVLQRQIPVKPIPSSAEQMSLKSVFMKIRTEAFPWVVTAVIAAVTSALMGSMWPAIIIALWELLFFTFTTIEAQRMNKPPVPEPVSRDLGELWGLCLSTAGEGAKGVQDFLSGWFYGTSVEDIRLEDMRDFITWATFSTTYDKLSPNSKEQVGHVLDIFEDKLGRRFKARGADEEPCSSMRFTIEPMEYVHKPSVFYFATDSILGSIARYKLFKAGFTRHQSGVFKYWMRLPVSEAGKKRLPIVFFHGIGVGLVMYLSFIQKILVNDCPVLCVELPFVATKVGKAPPSIDQQLTSMQAILNRWEIDKALFMGHSYGSVMLSWMIQHAPSRVAGVAFIDPVVILLNLKDVLYNFLYRREQEGKISDLVGSELYVNFALRRNFWWYRNIMFAQDIQRQGIRSLVCLSEKDEIAPSAAVEEHIRQHRAQVGEEESLVRSYMMADATHGQMLFDDHLGSRLASRLSDFYEVCDERVSRRKAAVREALTLKNLFGLNWFVTQGRWRLRKLGRPLAQFLAARGVGVSFGW